MRWRPKKKFIVFKILRSINKEEIKEKHSNLWKQTLKLAQKLLAYNTEAGEQMKQSDTSQELLRTAALCVHCSIAIFPWQRIFRLLAKQAA